MKDTKKDIVVCMLSGRFVTDYRSRHWSKTNSEGLCQLCLMGKYPSTLGTLEHFLLECPALLDVRKTCSSHWSNYLQAKPVLLPIVSHLSDLDNLNDIKPQIQFLLDPSSCPEVIKSVQEYDVGIMSDLLYMTRTWCHSHHLKRQKILRLYNIIWGYKWCVTCVRLAAPDKKGAGTPSMVCTMRSLFWLTAFGCCS